MMQALVNKSKAWITAAVLIAIACLVSFRLWNIVNARGDFYNELWGPAYLLVHGQSPYDTSSLTPELPAVWLPMGISPFAPLGWLDHTIAAQIWFLLNIIGILIIVFFALGDSKSVGVATIGALMAYFFPPTLQHFALGQFSIMAVISIMPAAYFVRQKREWPAAFLLAMGCTKPQLGFLAVAGFGYFFFVQSGLHGVLRFGGRVLTAAFLLSLPFFIIYPPWIVDYFASAQSNPGWLHPSMISILIQTIGMPGYFLGGIIVIAGLILSFYFLRKFPLDEAMLWVLGLTTIASPYIWSWDFVLLLPLWISAFARADGKRRIFLILAYLVGWMGMFIVQTSANNNNQMFWWAPLWFLAAILLVRLRDEKSQGQETI